MEQKEIKNYEDYKVNSNGDIISKRFNRPMKPQTNKMGYKLVTLTKKGIQKSHLIHIIVAKHFIPNPHKLPQVNHKDGDKSNNSVCNLEWVSAKDNIQHALNNGLIPLQEDHYLATISNETREEILQLYRSGACTQTELALQYGISNSTISKWHRGINREKEYD